MVKQVLIVNMDTPMSVGRLAAQACHASIQVFLNIGKWSENNFCINNVSDSMQYWMKESFTKVVCKVWGKEKLKELYEQAVSLKLPASIIEDDGYVTAVAIGPDDSKNINPLTRDLILL